MPTISLCMITYSEENNIRRCLESARGFVYENIVVDTGPIDRTKSICEEYSARVFDYKCEDYFAEARNVGISKASCDWSLIVDADEELVIINLAGLRHYLQSTAYNLISVRITHFSGALRLACNDDTVRTSIKEVISCEYLRYAFSTQ